MATLVKNKIHLIKNNSFKKEQKKMYANQHFIPIKLLNKCRYATKTNCLHMLVIKIGVTKILFAISRY